MKNDAAIKAWQDKIAELEKAEAILSAGSAKFEVQKHLEEARLRLAELLQEGVGANELGWEHLDLEVLGGYFRECAQYDLSFLPHARGEQRAITRFLEASGLGYHSSRGAFALTKDGILFCAHRESIPRHEIHIHVHIEWRSDNKQLQDVIWGSILYLHEELVRRLAPLWSRTVGDPQERNEFGGEGLIYEYPKTAVIEALTNFLIHRDYKEDDYGRINVLKDRVEFM